jgi:signal transduction histidine kinase
VDSGLHYAGGAMKFSIRTALLTVAVLGALTCVLALYVLGRPLAAANSQRIERARDGVENEVHRLRTGASPRHARPASAMFGMRSGYLAQGEAADKIDPLPWPEARAAIQRVLDESAQSGDIASEQSQISGGTLFVAASPTDGHRYAWAAYLMSPPRWTPVLRIVGMLLAVVSFALVISSLFAVVTVQRGASALKASLGALSRNLSAPVPDSPVRELSDVAEGISRLARELADAQKELGQRERLAVLGRVTAGVAHELRNPLALIKLRIDMVRRGGKVAEDVIRELADVGDEVSRLDRLVNDLLTVAGRRLGERSDEDVGELARRRAELMQPVAVEKQISLSVSGSAHAPVDRDALARVVDNLMKNAIEASPTGAAVRVDVSNGDDVVRLRCIDQGDGVPSDRAQELFEPFFTTKPEGVGLGLALSRAIAAGHGGALTYAREGATTVFELTIATKEARA